MKPAHPTLQDITATTLDHYNRCAEKFWQGTRDHDVSENIASMLQAIEGAPPFAILDFGCGPGRDLKAFLDLGHIPVGLEGSVRFAAMARANSDAEVWEQDFLKLNLPHERFDGVFANASLFHIPSQALPRVLRELHATLRPGGVLFSSNPRGKDIEGWSDGRYCAFHDPETWCDFMRDVGFYEIGNYFRPAGLPLEQQPWFASVWRK